MDGTVSLADVSDATATLRVGDKDYELRRLTIGDYAQAQQHMIDRRMQSVLDKLRTVPTEDAVLSGALADIVSRPVTYREMLDDHESEMFLLWRALQVNGKGPTLKWLQNDMPSATRKVLSHALLWATNIPKDLLDKLRGADPLADSTATGACSSPASGGTETLEPSATPTE